MVAIELPSFYCGRAILSGSQDWLGHIARLHPGYVRDTNKYFFAADAGNNVFPRSLKGSLYNLILIGCDWQSKCHHWDIY